MSIPTNDERREVARRLRILSGHIEVDKDFVHDALGLYMGECVDGYDPVSVSELADLIEPEERTCRNTAGKPFAGYRMFSCSECGAYLEVDGCADANLFAGGERPMPRYCPNCGARVEEEQ